MSRVSKDSPIYNEFLLRVMGAHAKKAGGELRIPEDAVAAMKGVVVSVHREAGFVVVTASKS